jgi:hypothetical protein
MSPQSDWLDIERRRDESRAAGRNISGSASRAKKSKSIFQSILDDARQSPLVSAIGAAGGALGSGLGFVLGQSRTPMSAGVASLSAGSKAAGATGQFTVRQEDIEAYTERAETAAPLGLGAAGPITVPLAAAEKAYSEAFAKPLSAGLLLSNPSSPLYDGGLLQLPDGEGGTELVEAPKDFWGRVNAARRRAEVVPFSRAYVDSPLFNYGPTALVGVLGGFDSYDPWSDGSMSEASENPFYNFVTGTIQITPEAVLPFAVRPVRIAAQNALGLRTTLKSPDDLLRLREDYETGRRLAENQQQAARRAEQGPEFLDPELSPEGGLLADLPGDGTRVAVSGNTTPYYDEILSLAGETRLNRIKRNPLIANADGIDKTSLADIIRRTDDPDTINELILASRGDVNALENLFNAAPNHVWQLSDMNSEIRNAWINGNPYRPVGQELARVNQIFDSPASRDSYFAAVKRQFVSPDGFRGQATWIPTRHAFIEKVRSKTGAVRYAVQSADYSDAPVWITKRVNSGYGRPATVFAQWASSRQPLGTVSLSGTRPDDWAVELSAMMDSVPELRGMRNVTVGRELVDGELVPIQVSAPVYRQALLEKIIEGKRQNRLLETWREVEDELIFTLSDTIGLDRAVTAEFVRGYRKSMDEQYGYVTTNGGYFFDEMAERVELHPKTVSQMLDGFPTTPLDEIALAMKSELSPLFRGVSATGQISTSIFDAGLKFFRTNVLLRPGYTLKFGVTEPLIAMYLAQGSALTEEGFLATTRNIGKNMKNRTKRVAYLSNLDQVVNKFVDGTPIAGRKNLRKEIDKLVTERNDAQVAIAEKIGELDAMRSGKRSPAQVLAYEDEVRGELVEAQLRLNAIEDALDSKVPTWRQVVEPATISDIREKILEYSALLGDNPEYLANVNQQINQIRLVAASRVQTPASEKARDILNLETRVREIDERVDLLSPDGVRNAQTVPLLRQRDSLTKQIDELQDDLNRLEESGVDVFGDATYTPNEIAQLERLERIAERAKNPVKDPEGLRKTIEELQESYDSISDFFGRDPKNYQSQIAELEKKIALAEKKIGAAQARLGERREKIASVSGITGYAGSGQGYMNIFVGGEKVSIPSAFSTRAKDFGTSLRAESSAGLTTRLTYDPSYRAAHETAKWRRTGEIDVIEPTDRIYWDELAWIGNSQMRGDDLVNLILQDKTYGEIAQWLDSPAGKAYQKTMGKNYLRRNETYSEPVRDLPVTDAPTAKPKGRLGKIAQKPRGAAAPRVLLQSTTELDEMIRLVNQYFPDPKVRRALAAGEVSPGQLQKSMGRRDDLSRIVGEDLQYLPGNRGAVIKNWYDRALDAMWRWIATDPEDRIARWPFMNREFQRQMQARVDILTQQGVRMAPGSKQFDALRQASKRAALSETEKVFYNIRRYNNPVYMSRFLLSFPGAFFNAFYRYGRLAVKEPERTFQAALFAENIIKNGGVDEDGNPVDDIRKARYLLIPGTKKSETDLGVRVPVESMATLILGAPGTSYATAFALSAANRKNPRVEEIARKALGPAYDEIFPYGIARNPLATMFGGWQKDVWRAIQGPSDYDFIQTSIYTYSDAVALWEKGGKEGPAPTFDQAIDDTRAFYFVRGGAKWSNAFSVQQQAPGQLMRNSWFKIRDKYPDDTQGAREEFMKQWGDWARWYTYSSSEYGAFIPSSMEAYDRIWTQHPDVARDLVSISGSDLSMLTLMTLGTSGEFSQSVNDFLRDNPLPGDDKPVVTRMQPEKFANMVRVTDGWNEYSRNKIIYDAELNRLRNLRDEAPDETMRGVHRSQIAQLDGQWRDWVDELEQDNVPWAVDKTDGAQRRADRAAIYLTQMFKNEKFAKTTGRLPIYEDIKYFLKEREKALDIISKEKNNDVKKSIRRQFAEFVANDISQNNPNFGVFYDRYFSSEWEVEEVQQ